MTSKIFVISICLFLIQCGENRHLKGQFEKPPEKENSNFPPAPTPPPIEVKKPALSCFVIDENNNQTCLQLVNMEDVNDPLAYEYLDPNTNHSFPRHFDPNQYLQPNHLIDIDAFPTTTKLAKNFVLGELMQSFKGQYGLFSKFALSQIQDMRDALTAAIHINSGFRSPGYNNGIAGAAKWSRHMYGDALDFYVKNIDFNTLSKLCLERGASFFQVYKNHIHCDWRNLPLDEDFYPGPVKFPQFVHLKSVAEDHAKIVVLEKNNSQYLKVITNFIEDNESEIEIKWSVTDSTGRKRTSTKSEFKLSPEPSGRYRIEVILGGSIEITRHIDFN